MPFMTALQRLEGLRDLASLEGFARLEDLEALVSMARVAPPTLQNQLLEVASAIFEDRKLTQLSPLEPLTGIISYFFKRQTFLLLFCIRCARKSSACIGHEIE